MIDSPLLEAARHWVVTQYPYNRDHLLRTLEWLDILLPGAPDAVRLAALTHDMERAFPGPDQPKAHTLDDPDYNRAHSERSARIIASWLATQQAAPDLIDEVSRLVVAHEVGGWPEADFVQAADSLSFLDTNIELFLGFVRSGRYPADEVRWKFVYSHDRIQVPAARALAKPLLERAERQLDTLLLQTAGASSERPAD